MKFSNSEANTKEQVSDSHRFDSAAFASSGFGTRAFESGLNYLAAVSSTDSGEGRSAAASGSLLTPEPGSHPVRRKGSGDSRGGAGFGAFSRDEMNLAEFPLAALSTRVDPAVKTLEFSDTQRLKNGELAKREWIITGADKFGLPTSTDDDVILGLIRLTMDHGFRSRKVHFTRYELMQILRWAPEGRNYTRLSRSLDRLSGVRIKATNAFFDNSSKSFQTCNFGIIDAYEIIDGRNAKAAADNQQSYFIWSEVLFDSFKSGFIKKVDLNLYFALKSAVSRRLYRYLDKHFYFRPVIERPLMTLAFEKLGLSRNYRYVSSVKQQLEPVFDELLTIGFLSSYEYNGRGEGTLVRLTGTAQESNTLHKPSRAAPRPNRANDDVRVQQTGCPPKNGEPLSFSFDSDRRGAANGAGNSAAVGGAHGRSKIAGPTAVYRGQSSLEKPTGEGTAGPGPISTAGSTAGLNAGKTAAEAACGAAGRDLSQFENHLIHSLRGRGLTDEQAQRLVSRREMEQLRRIHQIIGYYDFLLLTGDARVSKSPVGFLYRAVEHPERFTVPASYSNPSAAAASEQSNDREQLGKLRPELRIVRAERGPGRTRSPERLTVEKHFAKLFKASGAQKQTE